MKKYIIFLVLASFSMIAIGCGETISGVGKDASRIGRGTKTIFIRDSE